MVRQIQKLVGGLNLWLCTAFRSILDHVFFMAYALRVLRVLFIGLVFLIGLQRMGKRRNLFLVFPTLMIAVAASRLHSASIVPPCSPSHYHTWLYYRGTQDSDHACISSLRYISFISFIVFFCSLLITCTENDNATPDSWKRIHTTTTI